MGARKFATAVMVIAGVTGLTVSSTVAAQEETGAAAKKDTSKRVCRSVTPTGSRFTQRVCKTADQWQRDAEKAQRQLEDSFNSMRSPTPVESR